MDLHNETTQLDLLLTELIEVRNNLMESVRKLTTEQLDYTPDPHTVESIGTLLLHVAGVEWSWIFEDLFGQEMDYEEWKYAFALREGSKVGQIQGKTLDFYKEKLIETRSKVLEALEKFDDGDLDKIFPENREQGRGYTLRWIIYHVIEHEAQHIGQISLLKRLYKIHRG